MHTANFESSDRVLSLAEIGMSDDDIATLLHLPLKKFRKLYRRELKGGAAEGNRKVLANLHNAATSGSNMTATTLWVKARCGWRDTGATSQSTTILRSKLIIETESNAHPISEA